MILKRKILSIFLFLLFFWSLSIITRADTGTYTILDYSVRLTPHSDGTVEIEYYQKWLVTGGHIPWITVGTANRNYEINYTKIRRNVHSIHQYNSSDWSGVKINLDKDYQPNETFEVGFTLIQSKLFYADKENYKLDFTPGWYDNAITDRLMISIYLFAPIDSVKAYPESMRIEGQEVIWEKHNLGKGGKYAVSISFPKTYMPQIKEDALGPKWWRRKLSEVPETVKALAAFFGFFLLIIGFVIFINAIAATVKGIKYSKKRGIYFAGFKWPSSSGRSSGGGGGFGGRSSSCACACVSCACACACAGGGGAGCSKKTSHSCPVCSEVKKN